MIFAPNVSSCSDATLVVLASGSETEPYLRELALISNQFGQDRSLCFCGAHRCLNGSLCVQGVFDDASFGGTFMSKWCEGAMSMHLAESRAEERQCG